MFAYFLTFISVMAYLFFAITWLMMIIFPSETEWCRDINYYSLFIFAHCLLFLISNGVAS